MSHPTASEALKRTWIEDAMVLGLLGAGLVLSAVIFATPTPKTAPAHAPSSVVTVEVEAPQSIAPPITETLPTTTEPDLIQPPEEETELAQTEPVQPPIPQDQLLETGPAFITLFGDGPIAKRWYQADRSTKNGFWLNDFRPQNIRFSTEGLSLSITEKDIADNRPWTAGEIATREVYGYGRYEAIMKPAAGSGLVSSFFTYTGPYFGNPQDEIDIEFLGKSPRHVEFNLFRKGKSYSSLTYDLGFDATEEFHLYSFEWRPDGVTWFVDGEAVHSASAEDHPLPATSGFIMMNIWTGKMPGWHGRADFDSGTSADFACVSYRPVGADARACSDIYQPIDNTDYTPMQKIALNLANLLEQAAISRGPHIPGPHGQ